MRRLSVVVLGVLACCQHWRLSVCYRFADHISSGNDDEGQGGTTHMADIPPPRPLKSCAADKSRVFNHDFDDDWSFVDSILQRYWAEGDGFVRSDRDDNNEDQRQFTYGEVTSLGGRQLAYAMGISTTATSETQECGIEDDDSLNEDKSDIDQVVFFDLGSGVGRLVVQMYLEHPHRMKKSVGIELSEDRHRTAIEALARITQFERVFETASTSKGTAFPIEFVHGDALQSTHMLQDATHIFMSSLCFPSSILDALQRQLIQLPNIQVIAALNRLDIVLQQNDGDNNSSSSWWEEREVPIQMNWGPGLAKVYYRKGK